MSRNQRPERQCAVALPLMVLAQPTKEPSRYTVKDLGTLGGTFSLAAGINQSPPNVPMSMSL